MAEQEQKADIVERLCETAEWVGTLAESETAVRDMADAVDEIERLRKRVKDLEEQEDAPDRRLMGEDI